MTTRYTEWDRAKLDRTLDQPIVSLGLRVRTTNFLDNKGIITIRDLLNRTKSDLMAIPNFGEKSYLEVMDALRNIGFY